jgi:hypothetical protein
VIAILPSLARASAGKRWHAPELANDFRLLAECERGESLAQAFKLDEGEASPPTRCWRSLSSGEAELGAAFADTSPFGHGLATTHCVGDDRSSGQKVVLSARIPDDRA